MANLDTFSPAMPSIPSKNSLVDSFKSYVPTRTNVVNLGKSVLNNPVRTTAILATTYVVNQLPEIPYFKEAALGLITVSIIYTLAQKARSSFRKEQKAEVKEDKAPAGGVSAAARAKAAEARASAAEAKSSTTFPAEDAPYYSNAAKLFGQYREIERFQSSCMGFLLLLPKAYMADWLNPFNNSYDKVNAFLMKNSINTQDLVTIWKKSPDKEHYGARLVMFDKIYGKEKRDIDPTFNSELQAQSPYGKREALVREQRAEAKRAEATSLPLPPPESEDPIILPAPAAHLE